MRLIDADKLLNKCYHAYPSIDHYCTSRSVVDAKDIINAPTVDAVPVVHGKWKEEPFLLGTTHRCNLCGENYGMPHGIFNYCPNCGAKMIGERRSE